MKAQTKAQQVQGILKGAGIKVSHAWDAPGKGVEVIVNTKGDLGKVRKAWPAAVVTYSQDFPVESYTALIA